MVHQCEDERDPRVKRLHLLPMREAEQRRVCRGASTDWLALWEVLPKQHLMPLCAVYEKSVACAIRWYTSLIGVVH